MDVDQRDLQRAIVASRHPSLRQAAAALNIRQSTLSRRLRELEGNLGAPLFERTNGGTRPTVEGQEFLLGAQRIIEETNDLVYRFKKRARGQSGRVLVGVQASLSAGNLRATLAEHRRRFPDVEAHLIDGSSERLMSDLGGSYIDIAFVLECGPRWEGSSISLWSERIIVAMPKDHPLSARETLRWVDLKGEILIIPQCGPGPEFANLLASRISGQEPCRLLEHKASLDRLLTLVGLEWGILLLLEGATGARYPGVIFRELYQGEAPERIGFRACWNDTNPNPSLRPFLEILNERYPDILSESVSF